MFIRRRFYFDNSDFTLEQMNLGEIIAALETMPQDYRVYYDFGGYSPHTLDSWRGAYEELSLTPVKSAYGEAPLVADLLRYLKTSLGSYLNGYKGGEYMIYPEKPVWADEYGMTSYTAIVGVRDNGSDVILSTWKMEY